MSKAVTWPRRTVVRMEVTVGGPGLPEHRGDREVRAPSGKGQAGLEVGRVSTLQGLVSPLARQTDSGSLPAPHQEPQHPPPTWLHLHFSLPPNFSQGQARHLGSPSSFGEGSAGR